MNVYTVILNGAARSEEKVRAARFSYTDKMLTFYDAELGGQIVAVFVVRFVFGVLVKRPAAASKTAKKKQVSAATA